MGGFPASQSNSETQWGDSQSIYETLGDSLHHRVIVRLSGGIPCITEHPVNLQIHLVNCFQVGARLVSGGGG